MLFADAQISIVCELKQLFVLQESLPNQLCSGVELKNVTHYPGGLLALMLLIPFMVNIAELQTSI